MTRIAAALCLVLAATLFAPAIVLQTAAQEAPATKSKTKQTPKAQPPVEGSYTVEADAKAACGTEPVVWVNSRSKIYHAEGTRDYGKTRQGFYMCKAQADKSGFRAVRGNTPKGKDTKKKS